MSHSFSFLNNNTPLYGDTVFCFSIHQFMDIWGFFPPHFLAIMNNAALNIQCTSVCVVIWFYFSWVDTLEYVN